MFLEGYFDPNIYQLGPVGMVKEGFQKKKKKKIVYHFVIHLEF